MKWFPGISAAAILLLSVSVAQAGPIGPFEVLSPGESEYRVDTGGGYFHQGRKMRSKPGEFILTREEVFGTLRYTGYDWSVAARLGGASFNEESKADGSTRSFGFQPMVGFVAKGLVYADHAGDFGVGATVQATRYLTDAYQDYFNVGLAVMAQKQWGEKATLYGGPYFSYGSGRRKASVLDNNGLAPVDYIKETPLVGLCAGFNLALPRSMSFEVEGQYTGLTGGNGFSTELSDWGVGAMLRFPLWF
ncbi:MAG TPA: hypothetical protein VIU29_03625, partial [Candidatus Deferrimicrobiaceae bacterium]